MSRQLRAVRVARAQAAAARGALVEPAVALLARGKRHPLSTVGVAAGAGFVLGQLNMHPLRVPGLGALLSGTAAELVAQATRLIAEFASNTADDGVDE
ncbi:hypothetical protein [Dyella silvatica]|uniref:hypothetical protein n=1 Tax=Dyella silvatica TaxID=2992128 RepID=UPI002B1CC0C9|nr:hypothetical protein [Dyella silvatica]